MGWFDDHQEATRVPYQGGGQLSGLQAGQGANPQAIIAQWQQTHSPAEGTEGLIAALQQAGFNASPYMYGSTTSGNEITLNGEKYKVKTGDNQSWWNPSMGEGPTAGSPADILNQDPGYQFRLDEGLKALQRSAASRGTLLTGGTQKALERYGQNYAAGEFQNVFSRNLALAGLGERAALGQAGNETDLGSAQGASQVAGGNAWGNAVGQLGSLGAFYALGAQGNKPAPIQPTPWNPYLGPPVDLTNPANIPNYHPGMIE